MNAELFLNLNVNIMDFEKSSGMNISIVFPDKESNRIENYNMIAK